MKGEPNNGLLRKEYERIYLDINVMVSINSAILYIVRADIYTLSQHILHTLLQQLSTYYTILFIVGSEFYTLFCALILLWLSRSWCTNPLD